MAQPVSIRHSLMRNLVVVIVLMGGAILATTSAGSRQVVRMLSRSLTDQTIQHTESRLSQFFDPVTRALHVARAWGESGLLNTDDPESLYRLVGPLLAEVPQISSIIIADSRGREFMLLHEGTSWSSRTMRCDEWGTRAHLREWEEGDEQRNEYWKQQEYDPRERLWFQGALQKQEDSQLPLGQRSDADPIYWTQPYTFFTKNELGMTAAIRFDVGDGVDHVVGFDVALRDITEFTRKLRVLSNGKVTVVTADRRTIGLPADPRYDDESQRRAALLKPPDELGIPVVAEGLRRFLSQAPGRFDPIRFISDGEPWWGGARPFRLGSGRLLWIAVVVPESDLLGGLSHLRIWIVVITTVVLAVGIMRAVSMARRYSRPIESLVRQSERIASGDLDSREPIRSGVREVARLAQAQDRMRVALRSLLKLETDLALAKQIQQSTFPAQLPRLKGFDIAAWSAPAEETGGDTYDVIGISAANGKVLPDVAGGDAGRAVLLMADATGHGIGPALSVTQVRAMLRMGVRSGLSLDVIARRMNEQLFADLHDSRFITAWLGELNASDALLTSFSAGQSPLLHFQALTGSFTTLTPDAPPLGVLEDLTVELRPPIKLMQGDVFAVISDGVFEATNATDEMFGTQRVQEVIAAKRGDTARQILERLRAAVKAFAGDGPAVDDRTAIIIKRHS